MSQHHPQPMSHPLTGQHLSQSVQTDNNTILNRQSAPLTQRIPTSHGRNTYSKYSNS